MIKTNGLLFTEDKIVRIKHTLFQEHTVFHKAFSFKSKTMEDELVSHGFMR